MNTRYTFGVLILLVATLSCERHEELTDSLPSDLVVFHARNADSGVSKTVLMEDGAIYWSPKDSINLFAGSTGNTKFIASNTSNAPEVDFYGTLDGFPSRGEYEYWGVYPYKPENEFHGYYVTLTLPSEQEAVAGSFDHDLFFSIAKTNDSNLYFYNVCGGIKFRVNRSGITKVIFRGNDGETLAGKARVGFDDNGKPEVLSIVQGETEISLTPKDGGYFRTNVDYYLVAYPALLEKGYTITLLADEEKGKRSSEKSVSVKRSIWGDLQILDKDVVMEERIPANQIWYTTVDEDIISPYHSDAFGAASIVSNVYENGKGIITFDRDLTEIGDYAFWETHGSGELKTVVLPDGIISIGTSAFSGQNNMKSIVIPDHLRVIGSYAFSSTVLTDFVFPISLQSIGTGAFSYSNLEAVIIPKYITVIESNVFSNCTRLSSVQWRGKIEVIEDEAFKNCSALQSVSFSSSLVSIGNSAFSGTSIASAVIPDSVESIGEFCFYNCKYLSSVHLGTGLTRINNLLFSGCERLESIVIPDNIQYIGCDAFSATGLSSIEIGSGVNTIDTRAFSQCEKLESIVLPENVKTLSYSVFASSGLKQVDLGTITVIGESAFFGCEYLEEVVLPATLTSINTYRMFRDCSSLRHVELTDAVESVSQEMFCGCTSLTSITLPNSVKSIGPGAFYQAGLVSISIPENVESISFNAFRECASLETVNFLGDKLTEIEEATFEMCPCIETITLPNSIQSIGNYAFLGCQALSEIVWPETMTSIGKNALSQCAFSSISLPSGITTVSMGVLSSCSNLQYVIVPASVNSIEQDAFEGCTSLLSIQFKPLTPPSLDASAFSNTNECALLVPAESVNAYSLADVWVDFANRIQAFQE